ncbi:hypothetical protein EV360DRAFT_72179 [Lentinula raphanica]|nr:hypothetical protein EV360DRAFT_72179 [Lentinula raphanica]
MSRTPTGDQNISYLEILALVASSFPKLECFHLIFRYYHDAILDIDDLGSVLACFSNLRVLYLCTAFKYFNTMDGRAHDKSKLLLLTSILAKRIRTLDSIHINEMEPRATWNRIRNFDLLEYLRGWIHVLNSNRDVGGTLEFDCP